MTTNLEVSCDDCVIVRGQNPSVMELQLCPLHAAAPFMLRALKYALERYPKLAGSVVDAAIKRTEAK